MTTLSVAEAAEGIYSNAGVDFTMSGATDNGITFSASVSIDAGNEIDAGDFEFDGQTAEQLVLVQYQCLVHFGTLNI